MSKIKNIISIIVVIIVGVTIYLNWDKISVKFREYVIGITHKRKEIVIKDANKYTKNKDYKFVQQTDNFYPNNYNELINVFYTILDKGWDQFTFYCGESYDACLNDIDDISKNAVLLSSINNYVHPFNSYSEIKIVYDETGEIDVYITHTYTPEEIEKISNRAEVIYNQLIKDNMSDKEKIKAIHDYIINNTKYDVERKEKGTSSYDSTKATGVLFQGYGICSGYADAMAVFLYRMGIDSFKISSDTHVWNSVWVNNNWYHLDLTWDDPVTSDKSDVLQYDFFIVDSPTLMKEDTKSTDHNFNNNYYLVN